MYDEVALRDIFYSSQHTYSSDKYFLIKVAFLINHDYLGIEKIKFCDKSHYLDTASSIKTRENFDAEGGSPQHVALKLIGEEYLLSQDLEAKFEFPFCGYTPDVISDDAQTIIECGHTDNVDKIFTYFIQGDIAELIQLPYPDESEDYVFGYSFTPKSGLKQFLLNDQNRDKEKILNIINRKR